MASLYEVNTQSDSGGSDPDPADLSYQVRITYVIKEEIWLDYEDYLVLKNPAGKEDQVKVIIASASGCCVGEDEIVSMIGMDLVDTE